MNPSEDNYVTIRCWNEKKGKEEEVVFPLNNNSQLNLLQVLETFVGPTTTLHSHSIFRSRDSSLTKIKPEDINMSVFSLDKFTPNTKLKIIIKTLAEDPEKNQWSYQPKDIDYIKILRDLLQSKPKSFVDLNSLQIWESNKVAVNKVLTEQLEDHFPYNKMCKGDEEYMKDYEGLKLKESVTKCNKERYAKEVWLKLR